MDTSEERLKKTIEVLLEEMKEESTVIELSLFSKSTFIQNQVRLQEILVDLEKAFFCWKGIKYNPQW